MLVDIEAVERRLNGALGGDPVEYANFDEHALADVRALLDAVKIIADHDIQLHATIKDQADTIARLIRKIIELEEQKIRADRIEDAARAWQQQIERAGLLYGSNGAWPEEALLEVLNANPRPEAPQPTETDA